MNYQKLSQYARWQADALEDRTERFKEIKPWLEHQGSLTAALIELSNDNFKVVVLNEQQQVAYPHEQTKLGFESQQESLVREVELHIHKQAVVFARSIIPLELLNQHENSLANLGSKPLGHLLFKEGKPRVTRRDFAKINGDQDGYYARRTPYQYQGHNVLVSEFFLPSIFNYLN